jgi:prevent-host-death family protein
MTYVSLEEAGSQLARLIREASRGEEVILTDEDQPIARLISIAPTETERQPGSANDLILFMADDFDAPLPDFEEYSPRDFSWTTQAFP